MIVKIPSGFMLTFKTSNWPKLRPVAIPLANVVAFTVKHAVENLVTVNSCTFVCLFISICAVFVISYQIHF